MSLMSGAVARMKDPMLEVLLFKVGGASYGISLGQVVGVVNDIPSQVPTSDAHYLLFEGAEVPVFPAEDFLYRGAPAAQKPQAALIFDDGQGLYGMCVDSTDNVVEVTPGDDFYALPPQQATDQYPCRPWAVLTVSERPVILLDMSRVLVH